MISEQWYRRHKNLLSDIPSNHLIEIKEFLREDFKDILNDADFAKVDHIRWRFEKLIDFAISCGYQLKDDEKELCDDN